jgi:lysophospholipase L1-like esterase
MTDLPTNWEDGQTVHGSDLNAMDAQINADKAEADQALALAQTDQTAQQVALRHPARNTIAAIGDSFLGRGSLGWYQGWLNATYINQLQVKSFQRIRFGEGNFCVSGSLLPAQQSLQLPQVLAMNPAPGACILAVGAGEVTNDQTYNFAANVAIVESMVAALIGAGIVPIMVTIPPIQYSIGGNSLSQIQIYLHQWNNWVRRYAARNGFALIDGHTAMAQVDGTQIPGTSVEGLHPSDYGHRLIAEQALADGLADLFTPCGSVHTARTTDDLTNLFNDGTKNLGLFTTDTNADGVADGLTRGASTGTMSLVAPTPSDKLQGNWQQLAITPGQSINLTRAFTSGWSAGQRLAFACRYQTQNLEAAGAQYLLALAQDTPSGLNPGGGWTDGSGNSTTTIVWNGAYQWQAEMDDGELYVEWTSPPEATDLTLYLSLLNAVAAPAALRVGEVTVRNLTTGGIVI